LILAIQNTQLGRYTLGTQFVQLVGDVLRRVLLGRHCGGLGHCILLRSFVLGGEGILLCPRGGNSAIQCGRSFWEGRNLPRNPPCNLEKAFSNLSSGSRSPKSGSRFSLPALSKASILTQVSYMRRP